MSFDLFTGLNGNCLQLISMIGFFPYAVITGHNHYPASTEVDGVKVVQSGCLCGSGDDYTKEKRLSGKANQSILVCNEHGIDAFFPIVRKPCTLDEAMNIPIIKKFSNGDPEALKPMIEPLIQVAPFITKASIKNEVECCYTFDFPTMSEEMQQRMYFFYGEEEKAYKTCFKGVKKAYPKANYRVESGYGHLTYACKNTEMYVEWMKEICKDRNKFKK